MMMSPFYLYCLKCMCGLCLGLSVGGVIVGEKSNCYDDSGIMFVVVGHWEGVAGVMGVVACRSCCIGVV